MPELPEVESTRLSLEPHLLRQRVLSATLHRRDICESFHLNKKVRTTSTDLLEGSTITSTHRHGKQLAFSTAHRVLCVHLGMSGQLLWIPDGADVPKTHVHAAWTFRRGRLVFRDPRRFGGLWTYDSLDALREARWSLLGPDALTISDAQLGEALQGVRPIKAALLDQSVIAGVGNIYADEALFVAGVRPSRRADSLSSVQVELLAAAIRGILARSIQHGGSTLRDYRDGNGQSGTSQTLHAVYGRSGEPCVACQQPLRTKTIAQRTTVWCPSCQS